MDENGRRFSPEEMRRTVDPMWDIEPLTLSCSIAESIDLIDEYNQYLQDKEGQWAPALRLEVARLTRAEFTIVLPHHESSRPPGAITVERIGAHNRLSVSLNDKDEIKWVRGIYFGLRNMLSVRQILVNTPTEVVTQPPPVTPKKNTKRRQLLTAHQIRQLILWTKATRQGISTTDWCKREDIGESTFYDWRTKAEAEGLVTLEALERRLGEIAASEDS